MPKELDRAWQLLEDFAEAAHLLGNHSRDPELADTICDLALRIVGGDHASITTIRSGQFTTIAATSELPELADKIQYTTGTGPCLDATLGRDVIRVEDLATDPRWPAFGSAASDELKMRSLGSRPSRRRTRARSPECLLDRAACLHRRARDGHCDLCLRSGHCPARRQAPGEGRAP